MNPELISPDLLTILLENTFWFGLGIFVGVLLTILFLHSQDKDYVQQKDGFEDEEIDGDGNHYYVILPELPTKHMEIDIEEPLSLNHRIVLDNMTYKVVEVEHKVNGHTVFTLAYT